MTCTLLLNVYHQRNMLHFVRLYGTHCPGFLHRYYVLAEHWSSSHPNDSLSHVFITIFKLYCTVCHRCYRFQLRLKLFTTIQNYFVSIKKFSSCTSHANTFTRFCCCVSHQAIPKTYQYGPFSNDRFLVISPWKHSSLQAVRKCLENSKNFTYSVATPRHIPKPLNHFFFILISAQFANVNASL